MRKVLISGGGIAGLTLAYWLLRRGWSPTVIEIAPRLRGGGYMIDFWGVGFDVAERMGILNQLAAEHCEIQRLEFVDQQNRVRGALEVRALREMLAMRHFNLLRSSLERVLYAQVKDDLDVRFGSSIAEIRDRGGAVEVQLTNGRQEEYDLVIGAEGLRSNTRRSIFGPDERFERFLGYYTSSYTVENYLGPHDVFQTYSEPGKQVGIYSMPGGKLATFFIFRERGYLGHLSREERQEKLRTAFASVAWEAKHLLDRMSDSDDFYFDAVSQIAMPAWSKGRVALVGDACQCISLIGGQGSGLAMAGAYILAEELEHAGTDHTLAFAKYQSLVEPEIARKQKMAQRFASSFVPGSRLGITVRDLSLHLMRFRPMTRYFVKQFLSDDLRISAAHAS